MKIVISCLLILFAGLINAETFSVGGKELKIPTPNGFSLVTKEMDAVYRLSSKLADPLNDQLAYYITESDVPVAMSGKIPSLKRYFVLKLNKKLKNLVISSKDFTELTELIKQQNEKIVKTAEAEMPGLMKKISKGISKEFDVNVALKLSKMIPLDSHYEADNIFAYSMYINYGVTVKGKKKDLMIVGTVTLVNAAGKILFLYCYGSKKDLEWTRNASKTWAAKIIADNAKPPSYSSGNGFDWRRVLRKGTVGAIVGCLAALVIGIFSSLKRKKANKAP